MSEIIKPYGDTLDDGVIQLSFTLPVANGARAKKAAEAYAQSLNLQEVQVVHAHSLADDFTFFVIYAQGIPTLDYDEISAAEAKVIEMDFYQINALIKQKFARSLVVVGATIGSDAHTVGIDAIMNMKGYKGNYGLERYPEIDTHNLGAQISCEELLLKALEVEADAVLVSQTVTQKDIHLRNFTELVELLEAEGLRRNFILVAGGPRMSNELALELGYDGGFGAGTLPSQVASFIVTSLLKKKGIPYG